MVEREAGISVSDFSRPLQGWALHANVGVSTASELSNFRIGLGLAAFRETERFASRVGYLPDVYSYVEWPRDEPICLHNEMSYANIYPDWLLFAAPQGSNGITELRLADGLKVLDLIPVGVREKFREHGWTLYRNYSNDSIGISWMDSFRTESKKEVEEYCDSNAIEFEWLSGGGLKTVQSREAIIPGRDGVPIWFNQAAFLSEWALDSDVRDYLISQLGFDGVPFRTTFGNGDELSSEVVDQVNGAYESAARSFMIAPGDVLVLDNQRFANGRAAWTSGQQLLVSMASEI